MLKVIAEDFINISEIEKVIPLYEELIKETRKEKKCISYDLYRDQLDPGHFIFIETWPDREGLDEHIESEHFKRLVPLINEHQRQEGTYILMDEF